MARALRKSKSCSVALHCNRINAESAGDIAERQLGIQPQFLKSIIPDCAKPVHPISAHPIRGLLVGPKRT